LVSLDFSERRPAMNAIDPDTLRPLDDALLADMFERLGIL
jgi:hypothetical protein